MTRGRIEESGLGFGQILERFRGNFAEVHVVGRNGVRVDFARLDLERGFNVGVRRVFGNAEDLVVVLSHLFEKPN